jgi:hypothetical protein
MDIPQPKFKIGDIVYLKHMGAEQTRLFIRFTTWVGCTQTDSQAESQANDMPSILTSGHCVRMNWETRSQSNRPRRSEVATDGRTAGGCPRTEGWKGTL